MIDVQKHSLVDWVRIFGGIKPSKVTRDATEIRHYCSRKESGYNLLNSRRGRSLDTLSTDAVAEGWLPEGSTHSDFLEALGRDIRAKQTGNMRARVWHPSRDLDDLIVEEYEGVA